MKRWAVVLGVSVSSLAFSGAVDARSRHTTNVDAAAAVGTIPLASLPPEGQATYRLIVAGGPFPYPKDGIVFANRERSLPKRPRGFYHEYTVKTPGSRDRGARRIVCGEPAKEPAPVEPGACYYTGDHYATFLRIVH